MEYIEVLQDILIMIVEENELTQKQKHNIYYLVKHMELLTIHEVIELNYLFDCKASLYDNLIPFINRTVKRIQNNVSCNDTLEKRIKEYLIL